MTETLITRAAQMLSFGVSEAEAIEKLVKAGNSPEAAYLAVKAGKLYARTASGS